MGVLDKILGRFKLKERNSTWFTEIRGGTATFMTMAYILAVNASIVADSGGTCPEDGIEPFTPEFDECVATIRRDLVTATAAAAGTATFLMGVLANLPLGLAPGMGINAYFTYNVVGFAGTGNVPYSTALFAVFIEGIIFLVLALTGLRVQLVRLMPDSVKLATPVGIGLFLAHIGLQSAEGLGIVVADGATKVTIGGCGHYNEVCDDTGQFCTCVTDLMRGATVWLGIAGFTLTVILMLYRVKGAILWGIMFVTIDSWPRGDSLVTYFPYTPEGDARFAFFKKVVSVESIQKTAGALFDNVDLGSGQIWEALITFLYVDLLDTTGTLYSMAEVLGMIDDNGNFEGQTAAFSCDAIGTIIGALLGTPPVTTFIESGAGIEEGARTGLAALWTSLLFFLAIFFAPILSSIPPWATGGALVLVGALMTRNVVKIPWSDPRYAFPAFITIAFMPLTYSIAYGLIAGIGFAMIIGVAEIFFGLFGLKMVQEEPLHPASRRVRSKFGKHDEAPAPEKKEAAKKAPPADSNGDDSAHVVSV